MTTGRCGLNDVVSNIHSPQGSHHPPGHLKPSLVNLRLPPLTWSLTSLRCPRKCHVKTPDSPSPQNRTGALCDSISYGSSLHPHSASQPLILGTRSLCGAEFIPLQQGSHFPQTTSSGHQGAPQLASSTRGFLEPSTGEPLSVAPLAVSKSAHQPSGLSSRSYSSSGGRIQAYPHRPMP